MNLTLAEFDIVIAGPGSMMLITIARTITVFIIEGVGRYIRSSNELS